MPLFLLLTFVIYFLTSSGSIFSVDGSLRAKLTESLVERHSVSVVSELELPVGKDQQQFLKWGIGHSVVMIPFYYIGKLLASSTGYPSPDCVEFALALTNLLLSLGALAMFFKVLRKLDLTETSALALTALQAFATSAWQQSKDSFEHPLINLCYLSAFFFLICFSKSKKTKFLIPAALCYGYALVTRPVAVLAYPAWITFIALSGWKKETKMAPAIKNLLIFSACLIPFISFNFFYNFIRFGSIFETGQNLIGEHSFLTPHLNLTAFLKNLFILLFRWDTGFFIYNPVLILAPGGIFILSKRNAALGTSLGVLTALYLFFFACTHPYIVSSGWAWGNRPMADILPFITLGLIPFFEPSLVQRPSHAKPLLIALLYLSVFIQVESVLVNYNRAHTQRAVQSGQHSFEKHTFFESLPFLQGANIIDTAKKELGLRPPSEGNEPFAFSTFQFWWVYAVKKGVSKILIWIYLLLSLKLIFFLGEKFQQRKRTS